MSSSPATASPGPAVPALVALVVAALAAQATVLWLMGQPPICTCGVVRLWHGTILSPENSQQLTDWYTPSHIIHGVIFFGLLRLILPRLPVAAALAIALGIEIAWELAENSPPVIARYREQALAQGYSGDSILNSLSDTLAMTTGFFLARALPWRLTLALVLAAEIFTAVMVRDNLTLNVIQLIAPNAAISGWQAGAR